MEILLKALALSHYTVVENNKLKINFSGFSWAAIMDDYSCDFQSGEEVPLLEHFLNSIINYESGKKCKKAVFEAMFVAYSKLYKDTKHEIDYEWMCEQDAKLEEIKSSKSSVESRLTIIYNILNGGENEHL